MNTASASKGSLLPWILFLVVLVGAIAAVVVQNQKVQGLSQQLNTLQTEVTAYRQDKEARLDNQTIAVDAEELGQLRQDKAELIRLRNEVRQLREKAPELDKIRQENQRLLAERQQLADQRKAAETQLAQASAAQATALADAKTKADSIRCVSQLKQIGLAGRIWANDNNEIFPNDFVTMFEALGSPKILVCPSDVARAPAQNWETFQAGNVSYVMVSPGGSTEDPTKVFVQCPIHGHVCLADGSVQQNSPAN